MSRSKLKSRWMRRCIQEVFGPRDQRQRNPHKFDEMPKNTPSRHISMRCTEVSWMQESGSFGGHKVKHQGHRMVSGIVRQKVKEELRQQIDNELSALEPNNSNTIMNNIYTFWTVGYLEIDGKDVNTLDVALTPAEVQSIYDWFALRQNKWISFIPQAFRNHNQELYDKLYTSLVELMNQANPETYECDDDWDEEEFPEIEYDPSIDPTSYDSPFGLLHWTHRIFKELNINEPNVTIWVHEKGKDPNMEGLGYPIYLDEIHSAELHEIMQDRFGNNNQTPYINIEILRQNNNDLYLEIKNQVDDILPDYGINTTESHELVYSLYQHTIKSMSGL